MKLVVLLLSILAIDTSYAAPKPGKSRTPAELRERRIALAEVKTALPVTAPGTIAHFHRRAFGPANHAELLVLGDLVFKRLRTSTDAQEIRIIRSYVTLMQSTSNAGSSFELVPSEIKRIIDSADIAAKAQLADLLTTAAVDALLATDGSKLV